MKNISIISTFSWCVNDNSAYFGKVISIAIISFTKKIFSEYNIVRRESEIEKKPLPLSLDAQKSWSSIGASSSLSQAF
jgi:hypothetical protein